MYLINGIYDIGLNSEQHRKWFRTTTIILCKIGKIALQYIIIKIKHKVNIRFDFNLDDLQ